MVGSIENFSAKFRSTAAGTVLLREALVGERHHRSAESAAGEAGTVDAGQGNGLLNEEIEFGNAVFEQGARAFVGRGEELAECRKIVGFEGVDRG